MKIMTFLYKVITFFKKHEEPKSFFDYTAAEKKKIITKAAKESNKVQSELVERYKSIYSYN